MNLYHGSGQIIKNPEIYTQGSYKDFGYAFYCTIYYEQAKRWANSKFLNGVVNKYSYKPNPSLKVLKFDSMTEEWLDFIAHCRRGGTHAFDIVEGPMADDKVWSYVEDFINGKISRKAFWDLAAFNHPTHQIAFCTEISLQCITFGGSKNA